MKYNSAKGKVIPIVMLILLIGLIPMIIDGAWPGVIIFLIMEGFFIWIWFDTFYIIKDGLLFYKSAFMKGSLSISLIHEVNKHSGVYAGLLKPALFCVGFFKRL